MRIETEKFRPISKPKRLAKLDTADIVSKVTFGAVDVMHSSGGSGDRHLLLEEV